MSTVTSDEVSATYSLGRGRFDLCSTRVEWQLVLRTSVGTVSELFDDEPKIAGLLPSQVLDLIEGRVDHWLFSGHREEKRKQIAAIREHMKECDIAWCKDQVATARLSLQRAEERLEEVCDEVYEA